MTKKMPLILGKGFVGSAVSDYFEKSQLNHFIYNRAMVNYTDVDEFHEFLKEKVDKVSYIISCFGYTGVPNVDACETNKEHCWRWNVLYPFNVLKVANNLKIPVVHIGSGCVYTGYDKAYSEEDTPNFGLYSNDASFYSRCKHEFELLADGYCAYILRIRIPFNDQKVPKNYFTKLLKYENLIDNLNSVTSLHDFSEFMFKLHFLIRDLPGGIYNVVNPQPVKTEQTLELLRKYGLSNPNWKMIKDYELDTKAKRSNCVLSTEKLIQYRLELPDTLASLERDIKVLAAKS
jgi:dTDP-4-dehydrorhamnose reductase